MKQNALTLIILLSILLSSCEHQESMSELNTKVHYASVPQNDFSPNAYSYNNSYFEYYNANVNVGDRRDTLQFCHCSIFRGKITIEVYNSGGLSSNLLTIEVADSSFITRFKHTSDVQVLDNTASAVQQELTLNKSKLAVGDTLSGHINFTGLSISGYMQDPVSKIKVKGNFSCVLKEKN